MVFAGAIIPFDVSDMKLNVQIMDENLVTVLKRIGSLQYIRSKCNLSNSNAI